ncbi:heme oxygenase (biliverdin-producing) [Mycolicibacter hiberniae]|uniref:Putative heme oxygenase n=1 Tax=Mycolicibacter hiberniae TaxID=29314 RepID=A0A7I7X0E0_9MYCO|nr:biliverdin-producing heme oxygenase [Mycolicibacter hiberniae]MCV7085845.1 biliverdin-producing heme oxygenase [Mycolicibacter hiberniae]ORV73259.1 heme oxygenase [Mycolicibacter hiberniae]BBZ22872.1 putative heme oxygenase [Mycolicibacter hiberniae]
MSLQAPVDPDAVRSLSNAMREGSQAAHDAAEASPFVSELMGGRVNEQGYVDYLSRLRMVYAALEAAVRANREDALVASVYDPALERLSAIEADLQFWTGGAVPEVDSPAVQAYCDRIGAASNSALLAHHYTRYLGDLSGGQAVGRVLDRTFSLGGAGLAFYEFPVRAKPYKDAYRARLDNLGLTPDEIDGVVDEVRFAFGLNQDLFDELAGNLAAYRR